MESHSTMAESQSPPSTPLSNPSPPPPLPSLTPLSVSGTADPSSTLFQSSTSPPKSGSAPSSSSSTSSASSSSSTSSAASSSFVFNRDSENRFAKEEDMYGADLHLVNGNAFFGGKIETNSYLACLNSSSIFFFFFVPVRSDNGGSEGGSSGNALPVKGFDVNRMPKPLLEMMPAARQRERGRRG